MRKNPDTIWNDIVLNEGNDKSLVNKLHLALSEHVEESKLFAILRHLKGLLGDNYAIRILDYGCGGGQLLTYLRALGYENIAGVDVNASKIEQIKCISNNLGFDSEVFSLYDLNSYHKCITSTS